MTGSAHITSGLSLAADAARRLLAESGNPVPLHGDLHHENVLNFGTEDWRVIDPKGLIGERTFDLIHLLRNPDPEVACERLDQRITSVASLAQVDPTRLLEWLVAFSGLSAVWLIADGETPHADYLLLQRGLALLMQ